MSTRSLGGSSINPGAAPYTFISLLGNVALSEEDSSGEASITCVDFWNDNLYIGTSIGEILHYVLLPSASDTQTDDTSFILASRLRPEAPKVLDASPGVQQIVVLPEAGKACILCNTTLAFYSLPELSPAYQEKSKVERCTWVSVVPDGIPGGDAAENAALLLICSDRRVQLVRVGQKLKLVNRISLPGSVNASSLAGIACVADSRSYSLLDIVQQQQIPLFEINPQAGNAPEHLAEKPLPSLPTDPQVEHGDSGEPEAGTEETASHQLAGDGSGSPSSQLDPSVSKESSTKHAPMTSSPEDRTIPVDPTGQDNAEMRKTSATHVRQESTVSSIKQTPDMHHAHLKPNIILATSSEFLLTTGTSANEPGVGIFVNLDGDVVRGTLQFQTYPQSITIDSPPRDESGTENHLHSSEATEHSYILAIVKQRDDNQWKMCIEIQLWDTDSDEERSPLILDPRTEIPTLSKAPGLCTLGLSRSSSTRSIDIPGMVDKLRLGLFQPGLDSSAVDENSLRIPQMQSNEQDTLFMHGLTHTNARMLVWTTDSIWWIVRSPKLMQLDDKLDRALTNNNAGQKGFVERSIIDSVLNSIRSQDKEESPDEQTFLSNRYLCQKASLLSFYDLVVQTASGTQTYELDLQATEHALSDGDIDPRLLIISLADLRSDVKFGHHGMLLHGSLQQIWRLFSQSKAAQTSLIPRDLNWNSVLHLIKRYLLRWRRKKGYGSVTDDRALFESIDFALLRILLLLDSEHRPGQAARGSVRSELNTVVDEGLECFDSAVKLLETHQRLYVLSRLYQGRRQYGKVLETWKRIVEGAPDAGGELVRGEEEIRAYLAKRKDRALVQDYGIWLARRNPKMGAQVFADAKSQVRFDPREVVELLKTHAPHAVKEYLEQLVFGNNLSEYANDLIGYYLDSVLAEVQSSETAREALRTSYEAYRALTPPKPAYSQFASDNGAETAWWQNRLRLLQLLGGSHAAASQYDTSGILSRIERFKDLLVPETIILSGRQGRHDDAIKLLTHGLGDFDTAVSYCALGGTGTYSVPGTRDDQPGLPTHDEQASLFKHLFLEFLCIEDVEARVAQTSELLSRFARWFRIEDVLSTIPETWSLERLTAFLESALRQVQSEHREVVMTRVLTSSENLSSSARIIEKVEALGAILQDSSHAVGTVNPNR